MNSPLKIFLYLLSAVSLLLVSCSRKDSVVTANPSDNSPIPKSPDAITYPGNNPETDAKVELGRHLFYDKVLSPSGAISCASCHKLVNGFADLTVTSTGNNNQPGSRNSPSLVNIAYSTSFNLDGRFTSLEDQAFCPIYNFQQLGNNLGPQLDSSNLWATYNSEPGKNDTISLFQRINTRPGDLNGKKYSDLFLNAWGSAAISMDRISKSLAAFERTIISTQSTFDKYNNGDSIVFKNNPEAIRGYKLFIDVNGANCIGCHNGYNFTDGNFHDNGCGIGQNGDKGRYIITKDLSDVGKFKTPILRNIALSAPYMHDGRFATLQDVLENYNNGGNHTPNQDSRVKPLNLSDQDLSDIVEFLKSLTDNSFIVDTSGKYTNPWTH